MILINVSLFSQVPIINKIQINGENGFEANEIVMDSIMYTSKLLKLCNSDKTLLQIEIKKIQLSFTKVNLELTYKKIDSARLELQVKELKTLQTTNKKLYETDIMYYKQKAKGKLQSFLLGTAIGGVIIAILTII